MSRCTKSILLLTGCLLAIPCFAQSLNVIPLDFDGDGASDIALFEDQADGSPNEHVYEYARSSDDQNVHLEFGSTSDILAPGDYDGDGKTDLAHVRSNEGLLYWRYKSSASGNTEQIQFGIDGDGVIAGCDLDADGISDPAILRDNSFLFLGSSDNSIFSSNINLTAGAAISDILCARDAQANSSLVFAIEEPKDGASDSQQKPKKICRQRLSELKSSTGKKKFKRAIKACIKEEKAKNLSAQSSGSQSQRVLRRFDLTHGTEIETHIIDGDYSGLLVADFDNDGADDTGYFSPSANGLSSIAFFPNGQTSATYIETPRFSEVNRGIYHDSQGAARPALLLRHNSSIYRFFLDTQEVQEIFSLLEGEELLRAVNIKTALSSNIAAMCDEIREARDGNEGFLFKNSESGGLVVLFPSNFQEIFSNVSIIDSVGNTEANLYFSGVANGNRQHWRHSKRASSIPDQSYVRANGSSNSLCFSLGKISARID